MPIDYTNYPPQFKAISYAIRHVRANGQCECTGQCGLHKANPTTRRCQEIDGQPARFAKGTIHLTVAHLCQCSPLCAIPSHLIAACQRCHLRIDRTLHAQHRAKNTLNPHTKHLTPKNARHIIQTRPLHPRRDPNRRF